MTRNEFGDYIDDDREAMIESTVSKTWLELWATWEAGTIIIRAMDGTVTVQPLSCVPGRR